MSDAPYPELPLADATWLTALARTLTRDSSLADDLAQDTWMTAMRSEPPEGGFGRAWLSTVLRRLHLKSLRSGRRRGHREGVAAQHDATPSTKELIERTELQQTLAQCLLELDEPFRSTLMLVVFEGCSTDTIAQRDGVSASVVRYRLRKARESMRERLESTGEGGWDRWHAALLPFARLPLPHEVGTGGVTELMSTSSSAGATATVAPMTPALLLLMNKSLWIATALIIATVLSWRELAFTDSQVRSGTAIADVTGGDAPAPAVELSSAADAEVRLPVSNDPTPAPTAEESLAPAPTSLVVRGALRTPDGAVPSDAIVRYLPFGYAPSTLAEDLAATYLDEEGGFEIPFDPWVAGRLIASAPGFGSISIDPWGADFDPEPARVIDLGEVSLLPGASVSGQVTRNGVPMLDGEVRATLASTTALRPASSTDGFELTATGALAPWQVTAPIDAEGRFHLMGLEPGQDYRIIALPDDDATVAVPSLDPIGTVVRAPAVDVALDWGMRLIHFVVSCDGDPVPYPGVRATLAAADPRRQESRVAQDGLVLPQYGDEQGYIHAILSATDRQALLFVTRGYEELIMELDPAVVAEGETIEVQLVRESTRAQLDVRIVGPTPSELAGMRMKLLFGSHERGLELSRLAPIQDGVAHFESLPPGFQAAFYSIVPPDPVAGQERARPLAFFETNPASGGGIPGYLNLGDRLQAGEAREVETEVEVGGRIRVLLLNRNAGLPAPRIEAVDELGNRIELEPSAEDADASTLLSTGEHTIEQVSEHYAKTSQQVEIRERQITEVRFTLQP